MRRRHSIADLSVAAIAATVFGVAWFAGLWLVVITMVTVAAVTLVLERRHHRRLPVQLATVALHVPNGLTGRDQFERVLCARIAATSRGSAAVLARAVTAAERIDDPWRRVLALERLSQASVLLETGGLPGTTPTGRDGSPLRLVLAGVVLAAGVALGQGTGNRLALAVVLAGAIGMAETSARPRTAAPRVPPTCGFVDHSFGTRPHRCSRMRRHHR